MARNGTETTAALNENLVLDNTIIEGANQNQVHI